MVPVLTSVPTDRPWVALTFDDGPDPATTPQLLAVLDRYGARATFFLIGERAAAHPSLVADILAAGHELGNHLWVDRPSVRLAAEAFRRELAETGRQLAPYGPVRWFRPASGWFTPRMLRDAAAQGYRGVLGSPWLVATWYDSEPLRRGRRLGGRAHPGAIVVLHEGIPARAPVALVTEGLLSRMAERSLRAVTVSELASPARGSTWPLSGSPCSHGW